MKSEISTKANRFKVTGPVGVEDAQAVQPHFNSQSIDVGGQYLNCRRGGGRGATLLYHLVEVRTDAVVGFLGFETTVLTYGEEYAGDAMLSVEYVYVLPRYRRLGLSRYLLWQAIDISRKWMRMQMTLYPTTGITYRSASIAETAAGARFLQRFDRRLRNWCRRRNIEFRGHDGR